MLGAELWEGDERRESQVLGQGKLKRQTNPKDPAVQKNQYGIVNYYAVVFCYPPLPDLLRREPLFDGTDVCNSQENGVSTRCAAIVNHYAIAN